MRVLVVHNRYRSSLPSGENEVVDDEIALLQAGGVDVRTYLRSSDELNDLPLLEKFTLPVRPIYSRAAVTDLRRTIADARPDVVHVHNVFPLMSPSVISAAAQEGIPVVQSVHNYRHVCPAGTYFRDGRICTDCSGRTFAWPAVFHACYRQSRAQSAVIATALRAHRQTWKRVSRFLALNELMREHLVGLGVAPSRVILKSNSVMDPGPSDAPGQGFAFVGRLGPEKGVELLLRSWALADIPRSSRRLEIVGDGPLRALAESAAAGDSSITVRGQLSQHATAEVMRSAQALIVPSLWYEGLPRVVVESFAHGRPVVATSMPGLADVVSADVGWLTDPHLEGLVGALEAASAVSECAARGRRARARFESSFSRSVVLQQLQRAYQDAMEASR